MAVIFTTSNPRQLLDAFNERIDQADQKGKITTWERDEDGDYSHKAPEWKNKAWFRPDVRSNELVFHIIKPQNINISSIVYAYYHGHLIETFLNHFDKSFVRGAATALPIQGDKVSA